MVEVEPKARAEEIVRSLYRPGVDSANRLPHMLGAVLWEEAEVFWRVFAELWTVCDDTADHRDDLAQLLADHGMAANWQEALPQDDAEWFGSLPNRIKVHRGCSLSHLRGLSWTTDKATAIGFAKGHRGIPVADPVIATATISKRDVLFATNGRGESEVLLDFDLLKKLTIQPLWAVKG